MSRPFPPRPLVVAACAALVLCVAAVGVDARRSLALVNRTALTVDEVYLAPAGTGAWGEDRLDGDSVASNGRGTVSFTATAPTCQWDLKIVDPDDAAVVFPSLNLCGASEVTVSFEGGQPSAQVR